MQPSPTKLTIKLKRQPIDLSDSTLPAPSNSRIMDQTALNPTSLTKKLDQNALITSSDKHGYSNSEEEDRQSHEYAHNQLVIYDPVASGAGEMVEVPDPINYHPPRPRPFRSSKVLPLVGAFTVQCAICFKWRLIPTKEKYEEIREHISDDPFVCDAAREWRPDISCDDEPDIMQDGSRLWAIDKPSIAQPPPGWQRLLRIRGEGGSKFADVYYVAPLGKRLGSKVEIHRYMLEHPEYMEGVNMSQFSFQIPRPLQEEYVRKRTSRPTSDDANNVGFLGLSYSVCISRREYRHASRWVNVLGSAFRSACPRTTTESKEDVVPKQTWNGDYGFVQVFCPLLLFKAKPQYVMYA